MVITKECISFAFVKQNEEIDRVPLADVDYIKASDEFGANTDAEMELSTHHFVLQIATNPNGHNSGRSYYLRTSTKETYDEILPLLQFSVKTASKQAQASTNFQRAQRKVRKIYGHVAIQSLFALIIIGVSVADQIVKMCNEACSFLT